MAKWKEDEDRGDFGAWLTAKVGPDRTYDWLAAEMAARGHVHGADYYRAMAGGSKPGGRGIRKALRDYFGEPIDTKPVTTPAGDMAALIAEMRALTLAIGQLVALPRSADGGEASSLPTPSAPASDERLDRLEAQQAAQADSLARIATILEAMQEVAREAKGRKPGAKAASSEREAHRGQPA